MTSLHRSEDDRLAAAASPVPYVALGDSLTHGAQSLGVAAISQRCSYPQLIADFLGIQPFAQPLLKGDMQTYQVGHVGNPPNLELVLRRAERRLPKDVLVALRAQRSITFSEQLDSAWAAVREDVHDFIQAVEARAPDVFLVEQPDVHRPFQNLGVISYTILDVMQTAYQKRVAPASWWTLRPLWHLIERAAGQITATWTKERHAHRNPLVALLGEPGALLGELAGALMGQIGAQIQAEKTGYVLGREGKTALQLTRLQQPHLVTLFIGNTEGPIKAALQGCLTDEHHEYVWASVESVRTNLKTLIDAILEFDSHPYVFIATLPSPSATPSLVRNRLGHWKPLFPPTANYLTDSDLQMLESVGSQYNDVIRDLASSDSGPYKRLRLVDVHALHERMLRGTRRDIEAARRAIAHGMRVGGIDNQEAQTILNAVRTGHRGVLDRLGYRGRGMLLHTSTTRDGSETERDRESNAETEENHEQQLEIERDDQRTYIKKVAELAASSAAHDGQRPTVDDFCIRLKSERVYQLTGEYLATDAEHAGEVVQGGLVGLDGLHLTNTGYAYVARLFLQEMRDAHAELGDVLEWVEPHGTRYSLPGARKNDAALDEMVLQVASEDSLLNEVPVLLPAVMNLIDAMGELLGSVRGPIPVV
jgi:hypothetical protein